MSAARGRRGAAIVRLGGALLVGLLSACAVGTSTPATQPSGRAGSQTDGDPGGTAAGTGTGGSTDGGSTGGTGGTGTAGTTTGLPPITATTGGTTTAGTPGTGEVAGLRLVGRFVDDGAGGRTSAWSHSAAIARFDGTGLVLTLNESMAGNYYDVVVDGGAPVLLISKGGKNDYQLAQGLVAGQPHTAMLRRRTEAISGAATLAGVAVAGGNLLTPAAAPDRRIWAIGDSITCGYGVEGTPPCSNAPAVENAGHSAAAIAGDMFGADVQVTAWRGKGVFQDQFGATTEQMPTLAYRALPADPTSTYDPATFAPQVVIINLGTNDFAQGVPPQASFNAALTALLKAVRASCPQAYILCALGPMLSDTGTVPMALTTARSDIQAALSALGDAKVSMVEFPQLAAGQMGCDQHPNVAAQTAMATQLVGVIGPLVGWTAASQ